MNESQKCSPAKHSLMPKESKNREYFEKFLIFHDEQLKIKKVVLYPKKVKVMIVVEFKILSDKFATLERKNFFLSKIILRRFRRWIFLGVYVNFNFTV